MTTTHPTFSSSHFNSLNSQHSESPPAVFHPHNHHPTRTSTNNSNSSVSSIEGNLHPGSGSGFGSMSDPKQQQQQRREPSSGKVRKESGSGLGPGGKPLKRGDACLFCRKRKLKCDAVKPTCSQCTRLKKSPCAYDDPLDSPDSLLPHDASHHPLDNKKSGSKKSKSHQSDETIKRLEKTIMDLERRMNTGSGSGSGSSGDEEEDEAGAGNMNVEQGGVMGFQEMRMITSGSGHNGNGNGNGSGNAIPGPSRNPYNPISTTTSSAAQFQAQLQLQPSTMTGNGYDAAVTPSYSFDAMPMTPNTTAIMSTLLTHFEDGNIPNNGNGENPMNVDPTAATMPADPPPDPYLQALLANGLAPIPFPPPRDPTMQNVISSYTMSEMSSKGTVPVTLTDEVRRILLGGMNGNGNGFGFGVGEFGGNGGAGDLLGGLGSGSWGSGLGGGGVNPANISMDGQGRVGGNNSMMMGGGPSVFGGLRRDSAGGGTISSSAASGSPMDLPMGMNGGLGGNGDNQAWGNGNTNKYPYLPIMNGVNGSKGNNNGPTQAQAHISPLPSSSNHSSPSHLLGFGLEQQPSLAGSPSSYSMALVTRQEPAELPPYLKDRLLGAFMKEAPKFGYEVYWPKFWMRSQMGGVKAPHPAWLYAMYAIGARASADPALQKMEEKFFAVAEEQLHQGISKFSRLLDLVRAATLLGVYLYWTGQFNKAWMMSGTSSKLTIMCGLHAIPTGSYTKLMQEDWTSKMTEDPFDRRKVGYSLPPPESAFELGERILTFWQSFYLDRCSAIACNWPSDFHIEDISTPWPLAIEAYEMDSQIPVRDERYHDLVNGTLDTSNSSRTYHSLMLMALALIDHANKLWKSPVEGMLPITIDCKNGSNLSRQQNLKAISLAHRVPEAFAQTERAMASFYSLIPQKMKMMTTVVSLGSDQESMELVNIDNIGLQMRFLAASIYLYDVECYKVNNDKALGIAKRMLALMRIIPEHEFSNLESYHCMIWTILARIILKQRRQCDDIGDTQGTATADAELDFISSCMTKLSKSSILATLQAERLRIWRTGKPASVDPTADRMQERVRIPPEFERYQRA